MSVFKFDDIKIVYFQVGSCIVNEEKKIVGVGYNGMPSGCSDDMLPWSREGGTYDTKYAYVCHAEMNAVMNKNSSDVKKCTIYVTLFPCNECTKIIIQAGISRIVYFSKKGEDNVLHRCSTRMLDLAGISYRQFIPRQDKLVIDFNVYPDVNYPEPKVVKERARSEDSESKKVDEEEHSGKNRGSVVDALGELAIGNSGS